MDIQRLTAIGLSKSQAEAYALLIEHGEIRPTEAATLLNITRTNAYKVLDKLTELRLAVKTERGKTISYAASNPLALTDLTARFRAEAVSREEAASQVMQELLAKYHTNTDKPSVQVYTGRSEVAAAYRAQIALREDIAFIHTRADIPAMTFDTMHEIRVAPARHGSMRKGILSIPEDHGPINHASHKRSNLDVTWMGVNDYDAPVEWSVTESSLLIVLYATEPHAILISDRVVAAAFMQIWSLLNSLLQQQPIHQNNAI